MNRNGATRYLSKPSFSSNIGIVQMGEVGHNGTRKSRKIESIKKQYRREWLLIAVDKVDESTTTPLTGRLLAHSLCRDEVYQKLLVGKRKWPVLVFYSEDTLPKGYVAAF